MKTPKFYKQVLSNLERGISPASRELYLRDYFRYYLPSFTASYPDILSHFLSGEIAYERMEGLFTAAIDVQELRRQKRISLFDRLEEKKYGPRSMPPIPTNLLSNPLEEELRRFQEMFAPKEGVPDFSRVPGTRGAIAQKVQSIGSW